MHFALVTAQTVQPSMQESMLVLLSLRVPCGDRCKEASHAAASVHTSCCLFQMQTWLTSTTSPEVLLPPAALVSHAVHPTLVFCTAEAALPLILRAPATMEQS